MNSQIEQRKVFVIGLPGAGKTTFLAALWHVVESGEIAGSLRVVSLEGEKGHLNHIRGQWADAKKLERTTIPNETTVTMLLEDATSGSRCKMWIPDLSGEAFEAQWTDRVATKEYAEFVNASCGGVLFIHPAVRDGHLIAEVANLIPKVNGDASITDPQPAETGQTTVTTPESVDWQPGLAPTQVQLVDILQSLASLSNSKPIHLAVVISAWDLVPNSNDPFAWAKERLSLLCQYLNSNKESFDVEFFGISAQGGSIKPEEAAKVAALRNIQVSSERIAVVSTSGQSHDITEPIKWIIRRTESQGVTQA